MPNSSINTIIKRMKADVELKLPQTHRLLRNSLLSVLIESISGIVVSLHKGLDIIRRDSNPLTASNFRLSALAEPYGIVRRIASKTTLTVSFDTTDSTIPLLTKFTDDSGVVYESIEVEFPIGGQAIVKLEAELPSVNSVNSVGLSLKPIEVFADDNPNFTNIEIKSFVSGSGDESDEDFRIRLLDRIQYKTSGGSASDYRNWMLSLPNVTDVWVLPNEPLYGSVIIGYKVDGEIPTVGFDQTYIEDYIDAKKPVTARVLIGKAQPKVIDIHLSITPDSTDNRLRVQAELSKLFKTKGRNDSKFYVSWISEVVSQLVGEDSHTILAVNGSQNGSLSDVDIGHYQLPQLGSVTFEAVT